jgi:Cu/Ag efflux protein CusF
MNQHKMILSVVAMGALASNLGCAKNTAEPEVAQTEAPPAEAAPTPEPAPLAAPEESEEQYFVTGMAGGVMVRKIKLQGEVISVDRAERRAVVRGPEGNEVVVNVGEGAVNFYQVEPGDRVDVTMARELAVYVPDDAKAADSEGGAEGSPEVQGRAGSGGASKTEGAAVATASPDAKAKAGAEKPSTEDGETPAAEATPDGTTVAAARAAEGERPAGVVVASSKITTKISKIDTEARTATLTFEDGQEQTFDVRPDVDMSRYKVGQEVVFLITDLLALEVRKI